jgi:hypothetical protein
MVPAYLDIVRDRVNRITLGRIIRQELRNYSDQEIDCMTNLHFF